jgi:glycosyltransferase involved in cell wall biosynthesis
MSIPLPLISIIVPCYNYGAYLGEAIDSIRAQTYENWEMLIVDDGSKDDTAAVAKQHAALDGRIRYHYQSNKGLSAARNTGLALARGEYLQLLDADDYLAPTKLELQAKTLVENPNVSLVYGDTFNFQHSDDASVPRELKKLRLQMAPVSGQGQALAMHLAHDNVFLPGNPLFRKALAAQIGTFDEQLSSLEDWHFWYRGVLQGAAFMYDNQAGTEFFARTHGNNMSGNRHRMWTNRVRVRQLFIQLLQSRLQLGTATDLDLRVILKKHTALLYEEQARFNLLFDSLGKGLVNTVQYFLHGDKPLRIWYDSAYWLKERLLGRNKIST